MSKPSRNPSDSLKTQFSAMHASVPLTDIPSLPTPHLASPVKQYHIQHQIHNQMQKYDKSASLSSVASPTKPVHYMREASSSSSSANSNSNQNTPLYITTQSNNNYTPDFQSVDSNSINYMSLAETSQGNDYSLVTSASAKVHYQQQSKGDLQQNLFQHVQQTADNQPHTPTEDLFLDHHVSPQKNYQLRKQQQQQQQHPYHRQYQQQPSLRQQAQQFNVHSRHSEHIASQQQSQQLVFTQSPQQSVPQKLELFNPQYSKQPPIPNNMRISSNENKLPPINTQFRRQDDQFEYSASPLSINVPSQINFSVAPNLPAPKALPEHEEEGFLSGKTLGITQRSSSNNNQSSSSKQLNIKNRSPSLPFSKETFTKLNQNNESSPPRSQGQASSSSPTQPNRKSPIVRQSLNFFKSARNFSSSSVNYQPESPITAGHSSSREMEKYHVPSKQITGNGRVVPQKVDYSSSDVLKKTRSFSGLTKRVASNSSLRASADKSRFVSTTSLAASAFTSTTSTKKRYIYPAIISQVAAAFSREIKLSCHFKYGIEYRNSFSGSEAVDVICKIIRTRDRNLAIIIGRALDSQKLFHDVNYEHRLRDNKTEIYLINDEFLYDLNDNQNDNFRRQNSVASNINNTDDYSMAGSSSTLIDTSDRSPAVNSISGVFTLLTECYSPTCTIDKLCYSVSCPRRFAQKVRAETQANSLIRSESHISFNQDDQKQYWQLTVPNSVLESLDKNEIKRQECIFETINSEKAFVKDLEYIREFWIKPLSETKIIKDRERDQFIRNVFHNINEIWEVNHRFAEELIRRQQKSPIVESIADIFLDYIPEFTPFLTYGAGQVIGKYEFDRQRRINPLLRRFIEDTAKREESKRLDLSSFLSKPTTRPARYPLLLKSIKDHTDPESPDYKKLDSAIKLLEKMLTKINYETGRQADKMNLFQIKQKILFKPGELVDLKLSANNRKIIYQCILKKKGYQDKEKQGGDIHVYLFDHCLVFIKLGYLNKREVYKIYQRPIPLPLLFFSTSEYPPSMKAIRKAATKNGSAPSQLGQNSGNTLVSLNSSVTKSPISFKYIGIHSYELTLYGTAAAQKLLANKIEAQTKKLLTDNDVYTLTPLCSNFFDTQNRINCVVPFDGGKKLLYGTDSGIYVSDRTAVNGLRTKVISKVNIIQAEIIQEYQILVALCDKKLFCWPTNILDGGDPIKNAKLGKELMNHVSFFKIGVCDGRMLLCAAKSSSNIIRIFDPIDPIQQKKQKKKFINDKEDLHFSSEPVSINFLKTKLCVGCSNGFQIISLSNGTAEELLDPADTSLEFAMGKEGLKPLNIDRINTDFLLSYSNFSFFINHNGWRVKPKWMIEWEGVPHAFALWYPYLLAFDSNFIEIRNVQNAELVRVIVGESIRFLHASSQEILYAYVDEKGYDVVASLDFWDKSMKKSRSRGNTLVEEGKM